MSPNRRYGRTAAARDGPRMKPARSMEMGKRPGDPTERATDDAGENEHSSGRDHHMNENFHQRINDRTTAHLSGPQRTPQLKAMLQAEQQVVRDAPRDSYNERIALSNVDDLETLLTRSEANDAAREQAAAERQAVVDAKHAERQAIDDSNLKATIRTQFMGQPGVTDADFERLYPRLRDEHLMRQSGEAMAQARQRVRM